MAQKIKLIDDHARENRGKRQDGVSDPGPIEGSVLMTLNLFLLPPTKENSHWKSYIPQIKDAENWYAQSSNKQALCQTMYR